MTPRWSGWIAILEGLDIRSASLIVTSLDGSAQR